MKEISKLEKQLGKVQDNLLKIITTLEKIKSKDGVHIMPKPVKKPKKKPKKPKIKS